MVAPTPMPAPSFPLPPHRVRPGTVGRDWLDSKLEYISLLAAPFRQIAPAESYEAGAWAALKLFGLLYAHDVYLPILAKQRAKARWKSVYYVDLNAASGLVKLEGSGRVVAGSALIAANAMLRPDGKGYDHAIFVEPDAGACKALDARLASVLPAQKFTVLQEPSERALPKIIAALTAADAHYLSFFDPFGLQEGDWRTYGRLLESTERGDMLVVFQTTAPKRAGEAAFARFMGRSEPGLASMSEPEVLASFQARLQEYRGAVGSVRIKAGPGHGRYYYDLVYAAARTWNRSPFMTAFNDFEAKLGGMTGAAVESVLASPPLSHYDNSA